MFGLKKRKQKKAEKKAAFDQAIRKGLLFWLPGGASRLDVYVDYCIIHCLGRTKMKEKSRLIPFRDITKVVYTPATMNRMATSDWLTFFSSLKRMICRQNQFCRMKKAITMRSVMSSTIGTWWISMRQARSHRLRPELRITASLLKSMTRTEMW